jgi:hypothetical protein
MFKNALKHKAKWAIVALLLASAGVVSMSPLAVAQDGQDDNSELPLGKTITTPGGTTIDQKGMELEFGPKWRDVLAQYETKVRDFKEAQARRLKNSSRIIFSEDQDMANLLKKYPSLQEDFKKIADMQTSVAGAQAADPNAASTPNLSVHMSIAEINDRKTGVKILFVTKTGLLFCGTRGCGLDVYVDEGSGYHQALSMVAPASLHFSDESGVSFFIDMPDKSAPEWVLKDHEFRMRRPPEAP